GVMLVGDTLTDEEALSLAVAIRKQPGGREIALVRITALSRLREAMAALASQYVACLGKPVCPSHLARALAVALRAAPGRNPLGRGGTPPPPEGVRQPAPIAAAPARPGVGRRLLIAEDSAMNQLASLALLSSLGYEAEVVDNGRDAVAKFEDGHYDLILMDCRMPVMDGYEAAAAIRAREAAGGDRRTPIIALTASITQAERTRCFEA